MYWAFHGTRLTRSETVQLIDDRQWLPKLEESSSNRPYIAIDYDIQSYRRRRNLFKYLDGHTWLLQEGLYTEFYQRRDLREVEYVSQFKGYHRSRPVTVSISEGSNRLFIAGSR
jgi:hypothetical protein